MIESFKFENFAKSSLIDYTLVWISIHHNIICMRCCFKIEIFDEMIYEVNENYLTRYVARLCATNLNFVDESSYFEVILSNASWTNFCYFFYEKSSLSIDKLALICIWCSNEMHVLHDCKTTLRVNFATSWMIEIFSFASSLSSAIQLCELSTLQRYNSMRHWRIFINFFCWNALQ